MPGAPTPPWQPHPVGPEGPSEQLGVPRRTPGPQTLGSSRKPGFGGGKLDVPQLSGFRLPPCEESHCL